MIKSKFFIFFLFLISIFLINPWITLAEPYIIVEPEFVEDFQEFVEDYQEFVPYVVVKEKKEVPNFESKEQIAKTEQENQTIIPHQIEQVTNDIKENKLVNRAEQANRKVEQLKPEVNQIQKVEQINEEMKQVQKINRSKINEQIKTIQTIPVLQNNQGLKNSKNEKNKLLITPEIEEKEKQTNFDNKVQNQTKDNEDKKISQVINIYMGDELRVSIPGNGWVYLGEEDNKNLLTYKNRIIKIKIQIFILKH